MVASSTSLFSLGRSPDMISVHRSPGTCREVS